MTVPAISGPELRPRKVLLVAQRPSDFVEMRRCAVALSEAGWTAQMLYFARSRTAPGEEETLQDIRRLRRDNTFGDVEIVGEDLPAGRPAPARGPERRRWIGSHGYGAAFSLPFRVYGFFVSLVRKGFQVFELIRRAPRVFVLIVRIYRRNDKVIQSVLERMRPDAIILPEDVVGPVTPLVIRAGHRRNIPSVVLPYTIANQLEAFRSLSSQPNYQLSLWPNRLVGLVYPRWVRRDGNVALVRLPAPYILGHALTRTSPPDPWMMNSGFANMIAVENEAMYDYYRKAGISAGKLEIVGAIYDDYLARFRMGRAEERPRLYDELGIGSTKPLLVVGGCPDQTRNSPAGFEFRDMDAFCRRLGKALSALADDYELVVRPHPNYARMGDILAEAGIRTTRIDTARLVALGDLYVAFASATIRWAIACGIPSINYDVFHYDYDDFRGVGGVANVASFPEFEGWLAALRPGSETMRAQEAAAAASSGRWGRLDGQSTRRILEMVDRLCRVDRVPRTSQ